MKMFLISDNVDTLTGMRLAGIPGVVVHRKDELMRAFDEALADKEIGIILLTEKFGRDFPDYVNSVKPGERTERLEDEFVWLKEAGVAIPSYVVDEPAVPLVLSKRSNLFKLFMNDVGLLAASYMDGIQLRILNSELDINFGSVYENAVAQELVAHGFLPSYYSSREHGEIDFVLETGGKILPIEVKSGKHYKRHRALNKLMECDEYGIESAIVFDDDAMDVVGKVFYAPIYMVMFLKKDSLPANMIYDIGKPLEL